MTIFVFLVLVAAWVILARKALGDLGILPPYSIVDYMYGLMIATGWVVLPCVMAVILVGLYALASYIVTGGVQ